MHAVSTDKDHFPSSCVYCHIGFDGDDFYLVPAEESDVKTVYDTICTCSALNPDPEEEEEANNELFTAMMGGMLSGGSGAATEGKQGQNGANGIADPTEELSEAVENMKVEEGKDKES